MGKCIFCGESAGFFHKVHKECQEKHDAGWALMVSESALAAREGTGLETLETRLATLARSNYLTKQQPREAQVRGWEQALDQILEDKVLSSEEESHLMAFAQKFSLSQDDLNTHGAWTRAAMSTTLRDVLNGGTPSHQKNDFQIPFNFKKSETIIWLFQHVPYHEERIARSYVGAYQGASIKIAKGIYYHVGGFKGRPIETAKMVQVDTGLLGVTTEHLYFSGEHKSFRIPYAKIVSFNPYSDGLGICRDAATAKPQIFVTGEGWFIYNLVRNLAQR